MGTDDVRSTRTVLLVEDNPGDARLIQEALGHDGTGCELRWVGRLEDGLTIAEGAEAVLLDLGLPDSDGIETLRRWRHRAPDVPVVVLTGADDDRLVREAIYEGAQDYLPKSAVTPSSLRRVIDKACERHAITRRLERSRDELAQAVAVRDEVLATATHELRSPLSVLRGVALLLGERGDEIAVGQRETLLAAVARQAARLEELVDDLLELARHQAAGAPPEPSHIRVAALVDRAVEDVVDDRGTVELRIDDVGWETDAGWLRRIVANLVSNAGKYGSPPVVVTGHVEAEHLVLGVLDHGAGVPEDVLPRLFEPFTRSATTAAKPGSGLGLAIVARLAERLGGSVAYAPDDGRTRFLVSVPRLGVAT